MIHLSNISKQHGNKILYRNGSFQINAGEKIGLVGPNGAGKTTIFRIITGEEGVDGCLVSKSDRTVIGYFSQNIEDMKGRSALDEVKSAVGNVTKMQAKMAECASVLYGHTEVLQDHLHYFLGGAHPIHIHHQVRALDLRSGDARRNALRAPSKAPTTSLWHYKYLLTPITPFSP